MKSHSPNAQHHLVELWNEKHPVGTQVAISHKGANLRSRTACPAFIDVETQQACVRLEGFSGNYMLVSCGVIETKPASAIVAKVMSGIRPKTPN